MDKRNYERGDVDHSRDFECRDFDHSRDFERRDVNHSRDFERQDVDLRHDFERLDVDLENDGIIGLENNASLASKMTALLASKTRTWIVTASPWSSMTIASSSLKADPTGRTRIMSKPDEVGPPVSSPIMACLLPGQPSRRRGPPLFQGGQRIPAMTWRYRRCCPDESLVALPGQSAMTATKSSILLNLSGWMHRSAF
jgi:hypothetical protein